MSRKKPKPEPATPSVNVAAVEEKLAAATAQPSAQPETTTPRPTTPKDRLAPMLEPGRFIRNKEDASIWRVERVNEGGATLRCVRGAPVIGTKTITQQHKRLKDGTLVPLEEPKPRDVPVYGNGPRPGKIDHVSAHALGFEYVEDPRESPVAGLVIPASDEVTKTEAAVTPTAKPDKEKKMKKVKPMKKDRRRNSFTEAQIAKAKALRKTGLSYRAIGERVGIKESQAYAIIKKQPQAETKAK